MARAVVPLRVGVLGPVTAWRDGRELQAGQPRQLAVLGVLATRANRAVSRGELVDAVWGDQPPASAEGGIYTYIAGLRRVLEPDRPRRDPERTRRAPARVLVSAGGGYLLRLDPGGLDAGNFEQCLGRARELRASGDLAGAAAAVNEALTPWRGLPFAGVPGPFAEAERTRLTELRTTAAEVRADLLLARGLPAEAVPELTALVAEHPLRERARGLLMIALYRCGRQAEALQVFRDVRERLAEDLGLDPGAELTRIHEQLLAMDPALDGPAPAGAVTLSAEQLPPDPAATAAGPPAAPAPAAAGGPSASPLAPCPAQLPPEGAGFAGRAAELRLLHALLPASRCPDSPRLAGQSPDGQPPDGDRQAAADEPVVAVITGTAGVGKTTLAIKFARQVASCFPDGQLYVNLRGFDPASVPVSPSAAMQGFFDALGVPPRHVPATAAAQSALLRTLLDGKRMLLLLDNAHDADQVRPLLPGGPDCLVLVTSRSQLTGLVAAEGARPLPLSTLDSAEAADLLIRRLGRARVTAEPDAVAALVQQSAGLPLALSVACALAATRTAARLADLAAELADARGRLDALRTGEVTTDLRAVFSWSVDKLSAPAARMFRLLGLHPGPDISAAAAASLAGCPLPAARAALAELTRASLLTEDLAGRFGCHDLLRAYIAEQVAASFSYAECDRARRRLLGYYLGAARAAVIRLYPARGDVVLPAADPDVQEEAFESYDAALAWFDAEHRVLRNVLDLAAVVGLNEHCWKLAWYWAPLLKRRGRLHEVAAVQRTALGQAARLGDTDALAHVHYDLGHISGRLGDYEAADRHLRTALEIYTERGDRAGIGQARHGLALLLNLQNRYTEALEHATEALRLRRSFADLAAVAYSENAVGWIRAHLGEHAEALRHCYRALELHRQSGSRTGVADTLDSLGYTYRELADYQQAITHYELALDTYRAIGDVEGEAGGLLGLGDAQAAAGQHDAALASWRRALALLADIPGADTSEASRRIEQAPLASVAGVGGPD